MQARASIRGLKSPKSETVLRPPPTCTHSAINGFSWGSLEGSFTGFFKGSIRFKGSLREFSLQGLGSRG